VGKGIEFGKGKDGNWEGELNSEVGPVVVPEGWDYAAASMRNAERKKMEGEKLGR
jgi:hypothetical protein